nr:MAG TPA: hypothetical protein [Caudoviricetes sp.]
MLTAYVLIYGEFEIPPYIYVPRHHSDYEF